MDKSVKNFVNKYGAKLEESPYRIRKIKDIEIPQESILDPMLSFETEQMAAIHLPQSKLQALIEHDNWLHKLYTDTYQGHALEYIIKRHEKESLIRNQNHAVRSAYEKYLSLLSLVESHYENYC